MGVPGARHRKSLEIFQNLLKGGQDPTDAPPMFLKYLIDKLLYNSIMLLNGSPILK